MFDPDKFWGCVLPGPSTTTEPEDFEGRVERAWQYMRRTFFAPEEHAALAEALVRLIGSPFPATAPPAGAVVGRAATVPTSEHLLAHHPEILRRTAHRLPCPRPGQTHRHPTLEPEQVCTMIRFHDLPNDKPMSLSSAARHLGNLTGRSPHVSTLWRWCLKGCRGVRLESICIGGKRFVTASAIRRFIEESTTRQTPPTPPDAAVPPTPAPHVVRHNQRRREEIEAARRRLDELTGVTRRQGGGPQDVSQSA